MPSIAHFIYVVGDDVYVAKFEEKIAKVWKNKKELYKLTTSDGISFSIVVHSGDVYVAGYEKEGSSPVAKAWKNGKELYSLADKARAQSIFITEN